MQLVIEPVPDCPVPRVWLTRLVPPGAEVIEIAGYVEAFAVLRRLERERGLQPNVLTRQLVSV